MNWDDEAIKKLRQLVADGLSQRQIAAEFGTTHSTIAGKLFRLRERTVGAQKALRPKAVEPLYIDAHFPVVRGATEAVMAKHGKQCGYPIGDPLSPDFHYCAGKRAEGRTYCEQHHALAYKPYLRREQISPEKLAWAIDNKQLPDARKVLSRAGVI